MHAPAAEAQPAGMAIDALALELDHLGLIVPDLESAKNFAEAARILADSPGAMELRRLEALQNLSAQGTSKVIFDLAKPYADVHGAAGVAAALAGGEARNVRVAKEDRTVGKGSTTTSAMTFESRRWVEASAHRGHLWDYHGCWGILLPFLRR